MVRFTGRVREFRGFYSNVPDTQTSRWTSLCDEIKGKCRSKKGASYSQALLELGNIRDEAQEIIGSDAPGNDRDELAIKIYRDFGMKFLKKGLSLYQF